MARRHRRDVELRRRRQQEEAEARATQLAQEAAAARALYQRRRRRKALAYFLFALAPVVAVAHGIEHAGVYHVFSRPLDDLLIGYPTAFGLAIGGAIALGPE